MKLIRLQMQGFKSFADKTTVNFEHQIVGVVGPNGCGKSNIVDAIRWVMGEQSAKGLRGKDMADVIFAGTPARKPAGFAEVSLLFDNHLRQAPAPYTENAEIMITRRLFRSGESEYLINNVRARLKDINDLFLGTGSSAKAYSIVAQGKVDEVVLAKPEDRRTLIEEAAGIAKYKVRKLAAERKIESTNQNLSRVHDILLELERHARSLEKQVEKAEKFRELQKELRELDERVVSAKVLKIDKLANENEQKLISQRDEFQKISSELLSVESQLEKFRLESLNQEKITNSDYEKLMKSKDELSETERNYELGLQKVSLLKNQILERQKDIERLIEKSKDKEGLRTELQEELSRLDQEERIKDEKLAGLKSQMTEKADSLSEAEKEVQSARQAFSDYKEQTAKDRQKLEMLKAERVELELRRAGIERSWKERSSEAADIEVDLQRFQSTIAQVTEHFNELEKNANQAEIKRQAAQRELENLREIRHAHETKKAQLKVQIENLENLENLKVGYDQGALRFKDQTGEAFLMDLMSFKPQYQDIGEYLLYHFGQSFAPLSTLTAESWTGRWTQLGLRDQESLDFPPRNVTEIFTDEVPEKLKRIFSYIAFVDELDRNSHFVQLDKNGNWFCPIEGNLFLESQGPISRDETPYSRQAELEESKEALRQMILDVETVQQKEAQLGVLITETLSAERRLKTEIEQIEEEIKKHREAEASLRERRARLEAQVESLYIEIQSLDIQIQDRLNQIHETQIIENPEQLEQRIKEAESRVLNVKKDFQDAETRWIEFRIETGAFKERIDRIRQQCVDLDMTQSEYSHNQGIFKEDIQSWSDEILRIEEQTKLNSEKKEEVGSVIGSLELSLARAKEKLTEVQRNLEDFEKERKEKQSRKEELGEVLKTLEMERQELKFQVEELAQILMERYQIELQEAIEHYSSQADQIVSDDAELEKMEEKSKYLRDRLNKFGDVNLVALKEFEEVKERLNFMNAQKEDLLKTLDTLQSIIDRINQVTEFRFRETFKAINHNFQLLFPKLFGGGKAYMRLTDENDLLNTGVEIFAEPPGKKIQAMSLLSGGEKAMTSISLIFSLFAYRPSSFCILDEVDAPLDDINTRRYNDIIKEMSSLSQFIVITHNKRTMEIAETLFGVTMQDPGCSRLVGVNLQEATAFTGTELDSDKRDAV